MWHTMTDSTSPLVVRQVVTDDQYGTRLTPNPADVPPAPEHPRDECPWCRALPPVTPGPTENGW